MANSKQKLEIPQQRLPGFRRGIESVPGHFLILDLRYVIISASTIFLQNTMTYRNDIVGRNIFDVFPDNKPDSASSGAALLHASFVKVLETGRMHQPGTIKYDIPRSKHEENGFDERFWMPVNFPLYDKKRTITFIVHNAEDVTHHVRKAKAIEQKKGLSATSA